MERGGKYKLILYSPLGNNTTAKAENRLSFEVLEFVSMMPLK